MGKQEPGRGPSPGSKRKELDAIRQARNCPKTVPLKVKRIAIENHQPLPTRNKKDFSGIPELKVEGY